MIKIIGVTFTIGQGEIHHKIAYFVICTAVIGGGNIRKTRITAITLRTIVVFIMMSGCFTGIGTAVCAFFRQFTVNDSEIVTCCGDRLEVMVPTNGALILLATGGGASGSGLRCKLIIMLAVRGGLYRHVAAAMVAFSVGVMMLQSFALSQTADSAGFRLVTGAGGEDVVR